MLQHITAEPVIRYARMCSALRSEDMLKHNLPLTARKARANACTCHIRDLTDSTAWPITKNMFSDAQLAQVFGKTEGHCHFCGDPLVLARYAKQEALPGAWEIDHVVQRGKGGSKSIANCLPACVRCNRLRWHRTGEEVRDLLLYGLIVKDEIKRRSRFGQIVEDLKRKRLEANRKRRRNLGKTQDAGPADPSA